MNFQPEDRFVQKQTRNEFRWLRVEPDGRHALRNQFGGTEFVRPEELAAFYEALQWRGKGGLELKVGDRFAKGGEVFEVARIDAPQTNRALLKGDRGQATYVEPIEELFVYYAPATPAAEARAKAAREAERRERGEG